MEILALCAEICKEFNVECYQIKRKKEVLLDDDVFEEETDAMRLITLYDMEFVDTVQTDL